MSNLTAVVNDVPLTVAGVNVSLLDAGRNGIIHAGGDGQVGPLRFALQGTGSGNPVDRWTLNIWWDEDLVLKSITGQGELPDQVTWDDVAEIQKLLKPGFVYVYQLEIDEPNERASSRRNLFGVTRDTAAMLRLGGGSFVAGSNELTAHAKNLLRETAEIMHTYPDGLAQIIGHTDLSGSHSQNLRLSEKRAKAAIDYLVSVHSLLPDRFFVKNFSEDDTIVSNESAAGRRMNRRVEIVIELKEADRASLYGAGPEDLRAIMNRDVIVPGRHGKFDDLLAGPGVDMAEQQLTDEIGHDIDTTSDLPELQVIQLSAMKDRPPAEGQSGTRATGLVPSDGEYAFSLVARTDIGNHVELDGKALEVDATGKFESQLNLNFGQNVFVLSARNAKGFVRYANVQVSVKTNNDGAPIAAVDPIPNLVLQLPPKGVAMRNANLVVRGYTDSGNAVKINRQPVEVDENGHFITTMPLSFGMNSLVAIVSDPDGHAGRITRDIEYTGNALFIMALADGKVSQITREGNLQAAGADSVDEIKTEGRVALYLKGTVRGKYLITAAYDSGSSETDELFSEIDSIENERLLTNLDPDTIYPVYGDDSTIVYDTESRGKLYLALEGEQLEAVVGNYALNFTDTELTTYQRTLYGAYGAWR